VQSLGSGVIEGKELDFAKLASDELVELDRIRVEVEGCEVAEPEREKLRNYIAATQSLLRKMGPAVP
jgi:hypothetical protein